MHGTRKILSAAASILLIGVALSQGIASRLPDGQATEEHRARLADVETEAEGVGLAMAGRASLRGRVVDETGSTPRAARVVANRVAGHEGPEFMMSSPTGLFEYSDLPPGIYEVAAHFGAGLGEPQLVEVPQVDTDLVVVAQRGVRVSGRVTADGVPVPGAMVKAEALIPDRMSTSLDASSQSVRTDEDGRFQFPAALPAEHVVEARHESFGRAMQLNKYTSGSEVEDLVLELVATGWIEGRIAPEAGDPARRKVQVFRRDPLEYVSTTSDEKGHFFVRDLRPGIHEVSLLLGDDWGLYAAATTVEVHSGRGAELVFAGGPRSVRVQGRVFSGGEYVPHLEVSAWSHEGSGSFEANACTDGEGRFEVELPEGGEVVFFFGALQSGASEIRFLADGETTSTQFDLPVGVVAGRVLTAEGLPAAGAVVRMKHDSLGKWRRCIADAEGRFTFEHVSHGLRSISGGGTSVFTAGFSSIISPQEKLVYGYRSAEPFYLAQGAHRTDLRLVLPEPTTVHGALRLPPGALPDDIQVVATLASMTYPMPASRAEIDGNHYRLRGLGPGTYEIEGFAYGTVPFHTQHVVTVKEGEDHEIDLQFNEWRNSW